MTTTPSAGAAKSERSAPEPAATIGVLAAVLDRLCRSGTAEQHARAVAPLLARALDADTVAILAARGDAGSTVLSAFGPTRKRSYPYPELSLAEPILGPLQSQRIVTIDVALERPSLPKALSAILPTRPRTLTISGGSAEHTLTALVVCGWRSRRPLSEEDSLFLTAATDALGLALEYAAQTHQSHQSEVVLDTACAVARAISGSLDVEQTFRQIAASAAAVMGDCRCLLTELDAATGDLITVAVSDPIDDPLLSTHVAFDQAVGERGLPDDLRSIVVEDVVFGAATEADVRARVARLRSVLLVPVRSETGSIGCLFLHSTSRRAAYSPRDIARAEALAEQAASAICNARLYRDLGESREEAHELLERIAHLRERQRIALANVVHDEIVQTIVAALYEVEGIDSEVSPDTADLERIAGLLRRAITEARRVIGDLRPPVLDELGLSGAVRGLVERFTGQSAAAFQVHIEELADPGPSVSAALYAIAREALQNAVHHAGASHIEVYLGKNGDGPDLLRLTVDDDGVGFDALAPAAMDHFGLTMMHEQATLVGGTLTVTSAPGGGCRAELTVPIKSQSPGRSDR